MNRFEIEHSMLALPCSGTLALSLLLGPGLAAADEPGSPETIIITASPLSDPNYLSTIVDSVDRNEIVKQGGSNLADALANEPGVTGTSFASGASRPVIRGFDANRVRILENGIGSFDVSDVGPDHGVPIDPLSAQQIEVVRGAATLRYGSQAIGGVVNAINNRVPTELPDKPITSEIDGTYGTNANTGQGSVLFDARAGQFAIHGDGFDRHTDDYDIPDGTQSNSFFRGDGYSLGSSYFFGDGDRSRIGAAAVHYDAKYGIPGEDTFIDMKQTKEMLRSSFDLGAGAFRTLNVEGGNADYEHSERTRRAPPLSTFKDNEWDARAETLLGSLDPSLARRSAAQLQVATLRLGEGADYLLPTTTKVGRSLRLCGGAISPGRTFSGWLARGKREC